MKIPPQTRVSFHSLFNHFPEIYWQQWTSVDELAFRVRLSGSGVLRLWRNPYNLDHLMDVHRQGNDGGSTLLEARHFENPDEPVVLKVPAPPGGWRSSGALHVELLTEDEWVEVDDGEWIASAAARPVQLAVGFTTFNRPAEVLANARTLLEDDALRDLVGRIFIIDQGSQRVREHEDYAPLKSRHGAVLQLIEQENHGGAGGFTRAIMEAQGHGLVSHMLLMDDDAELEPEAVRRSALFLATSREPLAVGGEMLNTYRPQELVEAGGLYNRRSIRIEPSAWRRAEASSTGITFVDYNAWWFFAFPLSAVETVGLPLPLFIRGDDIEFGLRLKAHRIPTVTLPGIAVWHEPFYCKEGGWTGYYDLRNLLVLAMLHGRSGRLAPSMMIVQWVFGRLLRLDYYSAWLFEQAAREFLAGPEAMVTNAMATRQRVVAEAGRLRGRAVGRGEEILPRAAGQRAPRSLPGWALRITRFLLRHGIRPSPRADAVPRYSIPSAAPWWEIARHDVVVFDDPHQIHLEVRRRDRRRFVRTGFASLGHAVRLILTFPTIRDRYRAAARQWSDDVFWLNLFRGVSNSGQGGTLHGASDRERPDADAPETISEGGLPRVSQ